MSGVLCLPENKKKMQRQHKIKDQSQREPFRTNHHRHNSSKPSSSPHPGRWVIRPRNEKGVPKTTGAASTELGTWEKSRQRSLHRAAKSFEIQLSISSSTHGLPPGPYPSEAFFGGGATLGVAGSSCEQGVLEATPSRDITHLPLTPGGKQGCSLSDLKATQNTFQVLSFYLLTSSHGTGSFRAVSCSEDGFSQSHCSRNPDPGTEMPTSKPQLWNAWSHPHIAQLLICAFNT